MPSEKRTERAPGEKSSWKKRALILILVLFFAGMATYGQDSPTRAEIKVAQSTVKNNEEFSVYTSIRNVGRDEQSVPLWSCSYPEQWTADNPAVHIAGAACKKNDVVQVRLKPGEAYERTLLVRIGAEHRAQRWVTFRLGFEPPDHEKTGTASRIWSNAITVNVTE